MNHDVQRRRIGHRNQRRVVVAARGVPPAEGRVFAFIYILVFGPDYFIAVILVPPQRLF